MTLALILSLSVMIVGFVLNVIAASTSPFPDWGMKHDGRVVFTSVIFLVGLFASLVIGLATVSLHILEVLQ